MNDGEWNRHRLTARTDKGARHYASQCCLPLRGQEIREGTGARLEVRRGPDFDFESGDA